MTDGAGAERSEEQCYGQGVLLQRAVLVQGLGLPLPGSLQPQRPNEMEDL